MKNLCALGAILLLGGSTVTMMPRPLSAAMPSPVAPTLIAAGETGAAITTTSGDSELKLARHLQRVGAKMYGAYWCPHCHHQLQLFGREAARILPYVECDPRGANAQAQICRNEEIRGYPTWKIKGKTYRGRQSLEALAKASGYTGPRQFKNIL